ncbi:unnamed protein product, partial [Polarella glacialis]
DARRRGSFRVRESLLGLRVRCQVDPSNAVSGIAHGLRSVRAIGQLLLCVVCVAVVLAFVVDAEVVVASRMAPQMER